jgi:hypothetical protein
MWRVSVTIALADRRGRRLAVDANGELYQFLALIRLPDGVTGRKPPPPACPIPDNFRTRIPSESGNIPPYHAGAG